MQDFYFCFHSWDDQTANSGNCRERDKLLFGVFTQFYFWNTKLFFKEWVLKIKWII